MKRKPKIIKLQPLLKLLSRAESREEIEAFINIASGEALELIREICHNVLSGTIPLTPDHIKRLAKYSDTIHYLKKKRPSAKHKKDVLLRGGGIGFLFPLLFPLISKILS